MRIWEAVLKKWDLIGIAGVKKKKNINTEVAYLIYSRFGKIILKLLQA